MATDDALSKAYEFLEDGNPAEALRILNNSLNYDLENPLLLEALECCNYWAAIFDHLSGLDSFTQAETLLERWKYYTSKVDVNPQSRTMNALRNGVFHTCLQKYLSLKEDPNLMIRSEIFRKSGICCKKLGLYEQAQKHLAEANRLNPGQAAVMAEMADCYALCGEEKIAKMLFREAFFIGPENVDLDFLDSELILQLIEKVKDRQYTGQELQQWIPVYGVLYGVLTVTRELRSPEVIQLKQEIFSCENEMKNPANNRDLLKPRLLNLYFRLMEYYRWLGDSAEKIKELHLKIRLLDEDVYKMYIK